MSNLTVYPTSEPSISLPSGFSVSSQDLAPPPGMPFSIRQSQLYYWTARWRADEAESIRELEEGKGQRFETGMDAVRWLLSGDCP